MNKKTLLWIGIGLIAICFIFTIVALFAAAIVMCVLDLIFMAGAIICIALALANKSA